MGQAVTSPPEWRRRAVESTEPAPPAPSGGPTEMDALTAEAWESLDQAAVVRLRDLVWDQPEDVPGVRTGADTYVLAHAGPQPFATLGWATALLANRFEAHGDDADLAAATELHDLTAALGDAVWESPDNAPVALGAATLYAVTGEQAFLATVERLADLLCEVQPLSELGASILVACADLVEPRLAMEAEAEAEAAAAAQAAAASTANDG